MGVRPITAMTAMALPLAALFFVGLPSSTHAQSEQLVTGISSETIEITSNFTGTRIVIFGAVENSNLPAGPEANYDLVIVLQGPTVNTVVRRKARTFGIWINREARTYQSQPSSYMVSSTRPLDQVAEEKILKLNKIGVANLPLIAQDDSSDRTAENTEFRRAFERLKISSKLYLETAGTVEFMSRSMFRAAIEIPSNIPVGFHFMTAYLFHKGKLVTSQSVSLEIKKTGFERFAYQTAHEEPFLYGIVAVLMAIATGWIAGVIFRKN